MRVFADEYLETSWGDKYPSLYGCDDIRRSNHIEVKNYKGTKTQYLSELHQS